MSQPVQPWMLEAGKEVEKVDADSLASDGIVGINPVGWLMVSEIIAHHAPEDHTAELVAELKSGVERVSRAHRRQDCYCDLCVWSGKAEELLAKVEGKR